MSRMTLVALALLVASASIATAQTNSAISGVIVDETGLVLPGVTVEASSPALIESCAR